MKKKKFRFLSTKKNNDRLKKVFLISSLKSNRILKNLKINSIFATIKSKFKKSITSFKLQRKKSLSKIIYYDGQLSCIYMRTFFYLNFINFSPKKISKRNWNHLWFLLISVRLNEWSFWGKQIRHFEIIKE